MGPRIEISGLGGRVYFNNSEKAVLVIEDLKRGHSHGGVGLWAVTLKILRVRFAIWDLRKSEKYYFGLCSC